MGKSVQAAIWDEVEGLITRCGAVTESMDMDLSRKNWWGLPWNMKGKSPTSARMPAPARLIIPAKW